MPRQTASLPLRMRLPKGRWLRVSLLPAAARRSDLEAISRTTAANHHRAFAELRRHEIALDRADRSYADLQARVQELEERSDVALAGLLDAVQGLGQRLALAKNLQPQALAAKKGAARAARRELRPPGELLQNVNAAVTSMQVAAYGEKGSLLNVNNLMLVGNQLLWSSIGPGLRALGIPPWITPVCSLALGALTAGRNQHVRFVAGVATFLEGQLVVTVPLRERLGGAFFAGFRQRTDVPVTTTLLDPAAEAGVGGTVRDGTLLVALTKKAPAAIRVAWLVDTGIENG